MSAEITVTFDLADDEDERRGLVEEILRLQTQLDALPKDAGLARGSLQSTIDGLKRRLSAMDQFDEDSIEDLDAEALDNLIEDLVSAINGETDFQTKQYLMSILQKARSARARLGETTSTAPDVILKQRILRSGFALLSFYPAEKRN